jgi:hypothetical protein
MVFNISDDILTSLYNLFENNICIVLPILPISLIENIFEYLHHDYKLIIYKESEQNKNTKVLSIELIMISRMENYFTDVYYLTSSKKNYVMKLVN